jgi:1,4-alpha-glucan branching enzyme
MLEHRESIVAAAHNAGMLSDSDLNLLLQACHPDPFAVLGMHHDADGDLWVRCLLPGAQRAVLHDTRTGRRVVELLRREGTPLFEALLPRRRNLFDYRLKIRWDDGHESLTCDPYRYGPLIGEQDLYFLGEGSHLRPFEVLGAHPLRLGDEVYAIEGVRFAVWAPNAQRVSVVGSFNGWDGRRHPMRNRGPSGIWELFIPGVAVGDAYKLEIRTHAGAVLPLKCDPYARGAQMRPDNASLVCAALPPRDPLPAGRARANSRNAAVSIYEVHLGSWRRHPDGRFYTWDELAEALPAYVAEMGFTHIELLPITEHPFDGSWGYQALGLYAPTSRFGAPEGYARFVTACHDVGLGVILDWVPAHFPTDAHGLAQFDGTALYEYADPKEGFHLDWQTLIYNFGRNEVRNFLTGSALYWLERGGADGLRVDAVASMLYRDYSRKSGEWIPNVHGGRENLEAIAFLKRTNEVIGSEVPGAITMAEESTAFPGVSAPTYAGGLGFHYKWNMGWMNDTLRYMQEDPVNRRWHHDLMTFGLMYAFSENFVLPLSHDEVVHGKGSLLARMPGDDWQKRANLRAYLGFMWGHPGKKLLFMGQEWGQPGEWNHDVELPWGQLQDERHGGLQRWVRDLNRLYRDEAALHRLDCEASGFEWIDAQDRDQSIFSWVRRDGQGRSAIVVCNMTPVPRPHHRLGLPWAEAQRGGAWREALNSDAALYGGSNLGNGGAPLPVADVPAQGHAHSIALLLPPLATIVLVPAA